MLAHAEFATALSRGMLSEDAAGGGGASGYSSELVLCGGAFVDLVLAHSGDLGALLRVEQAYPEVERVATRFSDALRGLLGATRVAAGRGDEAASGLLTSLSMNGFFE